jgi:hypothetical protein
MIPLLNQLKLNELMIYNTNLTIKQLSFISIPTLTKFTYYNNGDLDINLYIDTLISFQCLRYISICFELTIEQFKYLIINTNLDIFEYLYHTIDHIEMIELLINTNIHTFHLLCAYKLFCFQYRSIWLSLISHTRSVRIESLTLNTYYYRYQCGDCLHGHFRQLSFNHLRKQLLSLTKCVCKQVSDHDEHEQDDEDDTM